MTIKKVLKKVSLILIILLFLVTLTALGSVIFEMANGREPSIFGYRLYYVLTDSMTPNLQVGDFILSRTIRNEEDLSNIKVGDVVTFIGNSGVQNGKIITHRVVQVYPEAEEGFIKTQGDKPGSPMDAPVSLANVRAVQRAHLPILGQTFTFLRATSWLIIILICVIIVAFAVPAVLKKIKTDKAKSD